jgi:hypothetical protein
VSIRPIPAYRQAGVLSPIENRDRRVPFVLYIETR